MAKVCEERRKMLSLDTSGPKVLKLFSSSTQLSMKFHLVIKIKIPTVKTVFMLS